jgi:hypothetical protein
MPVKNQFQGMLAVFEPLDRAQSKKNFEPSFVKIGCMDLSVKIKSGSDTFWTVKQIANITSSMFSFIFLTEQLIINGKKQKITYESPFTSFCGIMNP